MTTEQLTARESQALEHLRKAEELDVSIAEYCRSFELDVKDIYSAKQSLIAGSHLPRQRRRASRLLHASLRTSALLKGLFKAAAAPRT